MAEAQTESCEEEAVEPQPGLITLIRVFIRVVVSAALGAALWLMDLRVYGDTGPLPDIVASPIFGVWIGAAAAIIWGPIIELAVPRAVERHRWIALLGSMVMMCAAAGMVWASPSAADWWGLRMIVMSSLAAAVVEAIALRVYVRAEQPPAEAPPAEEPSEEEPSTERAAEAS